MHHLVTQLALHLALEAVGLPRNLMPPIMPDADYVPCEKACDAEHITAGKEGIKRHEYSTDLREPSYYCFTYPSLEAFIRKFTDEPIEYACTSSMANTGSEWLQQVIAAGSSDRFLEVRRQFRSGFDHRLESYLNSIPFRLLNEMMQL